MITLNKLTGSGGGGGPSGPPNFSYQVIADGETVTIPEGQLMFYKDAISIQGDLYTLGDLVENYDDNQDEWPRSVIDTGEVVVVSLNRVMFYKNSISILGDLRVQGDLIEVA
jgi:hypothetical protein